MKDRNRYRNSEIQRFDSPRLSGHLKMPTDHTEKGFENAIEESLLTQGGYVRGNAEAFDRELALDPVTLIGFLKDTQPNEWSKLEAIYGADVAAKVVKYVASECDQRGMLDVLRKGITDHGAKIRLAYFKPATGLNPETLALYGKKRSDNHPPSALFPEERELHRCAVISEWFAHCHR